MKLFPARFARRGTITRLRKHWNPHVQSLLTKEPFQVRSPAGIVSCCKLPVPGGRKIAMRLKRDGGDEPIEARLAPPPLHRDEAGNGRRSLSRSAPDFHSWLGECRPPPLPTGKKGIAVMRSCFVTAGNGVVRGDCDPL